jgi:hypothetical protein
VNAAVTALSVRPFGEAGDLEIDFNSDDRPTLATQVLSRCVVASESFWWAQTLGRRISALLRLVVVTNSRATLDLSARCTQPGCENSFEFELPIDRLAPGLADDVVDIPLGDDRRVRLRLPTGADLRDWRARIDPARLDAQQTMLDSLRMEGEIRVADVAAIDECLGKLDPLVDFSIQGPCPACRADMEMPIDLEQLALSSLRVSQRRLLREVHELASRYGWTEAETLAIPQHRRAAYRELIEDSQ